MSEEGLRVRDQRVLSKVRDVPLVVLPGGGYQLDSWRIHAGTLAEMVGHSRSVARGYDPLKRRTREIMRRLDPGQLNDDDGDVLITEAELFGALNAAPAPTPRILDFYTRHGLEYALNVYGFWPLLERMGFQGLRLEVTHDGGRDHVRVTAKVGSEHLPLCDVVVRQVRIGDFRTLFVDWLELQDPRVAFTSSRPRLPGQRRPGLGIGDEVTQLLVRGAERLNLDGVAFVPAYFHIAWMGRRQFVVVDTELRGRFEALVEHLADLPLVEASAMLQDPGWPLKDGDRLRWTPTEMMIPVSRAARIALRPSHPEAEASRKAWLSRMESNSDPQ